MKQNNIDFLIENDFNKKLKALKKYCPRAYKFLIFNFKNSNYYELDDGEYEKKLPTSEDFKFVYGQIRLIYKIINKTPVFINIEPAQFFIDGYNFDLNTYKQIYYRNERDKFKIDLFIKMRERNLDI